MQAKTPMTRLMQLGHPKCVEVTKDTKISGENLV